MNTLSDQPVGLEVLVIDDEPDKDDKLMLLETLERLGFIVQWRTKWSGVYDLLRERYESGKPFPDVAFVDLHFFKPELAAVPDQEGKAIIRELERACLFWDRPVFPRIAFTQRLREVTKEEYVQAGACDFIGLPKSQDPEVLRIWLIRLLQDIDDAGDNPLRQTESEPSAKEVLNGL